MNKYSLVLLLLFISCKAAQTPIEQHLENVKQSSERNVSDRTPEWVQTKPFSNEYYIGIGNASLRNPEFHSIAKKEALDDLASEIAITIESKSVLNQIETRSDFRESYNADIKASTSQELQSYELRDSWRNDEQYWVYYQLSKAKFQEIKLKKKSQLTTLAKDNYIKATEARNKRDYVLTLHYYAQCIENLKDYLYKKNEVLVQGEKVLLINEAYAGILEILGKIHLEKPVTPISFLEQTRKTITLTAFFTSGQVPIQNLPVILKFRNEIVKKITDDDGKISIDVTKNQAASRTLVAEVSHDFLMDYNTVWSMLPQMRFSQLEISFQSPAPTFFIKTREVNLSNQLTNPILSPLISKILLREGAIIGKENESEYVFELVSSTRRGSEFSGLYSTYMDFSFSIKDTDGQTVFSGSYSNIKGLHNSFEKAGIRAYENVENELSEEIEESLNKNFFSKY